MRKTIYFAGMLFGLGLLWTGCTEEEWVLHPEEPEIPVEMGESRYFDFSIAFDESERAGYAAMPDVAPSGDMAYVENQTFADVVTLTYSEEGVQVDNTNPMIFVQANGTDVEVYSFVTTGVDFVLKGACSNGTFKVSTSNSDYKITLAGVELTRPSGAVIYAIPDVKARAFIYAEPGTVNKLSGCMDANSTEKATVKTGADIVFCGEGVTEIVSNRRHAVDTKGSVYFRGGCKLRITTVDNGAVAGEDQPEDGVHADGDVVMTGGEVDVMTVGDGVQSESGQVYLKGGFMKVTTSGEKSHAIKAPEGVGISDGAFQACVEGNASKCISTDGGLEMTGGRVTLITKGNAIYDAETNDMSSCAGVKAARDIRVDGGSLQINSTGDGGKGINTDGALTVSGNAEVKVITSGHKAVSNGLDSNPKGISADAGITMAGRTLWVNAVGGTSGCDGLATKHSVTISAGDVRLRCFDDCVKADRDITVTGGTLCSYSEGNDGLDADGRITVSGGLVVTCGAAATPDGGKGEGVDGTDFVVSGGTLVALGGGSSTPSDASSQNSVLYAMDAMSDARDVYILRNEAGESVMAFRLPAAFQPVKLTFSSPELKTGSGYSLSKGWIVDQDDCDGVFGYFVSVPCRDEVQISSFGIHSAVTKVSAQ